MSFKARLDSAQFENDLRRLAAATKKTLPAVLDQAACVVVRNALMLTPPFDPKRKENRAAQGLDTEKPASWGQQRAVGNNAVSKDLGKLFKAWEKAGVFRSEGGTEKGKRLSRAIAQALRHGNVTLANQLLERGHWKERAVGWVTRPLHDANRNRRGRVLTRGQGGKSFFVQHAGSAADFTKRKLKFIGYAKSGWARAYLALGGKLPGWLRQEHGHGLFQRSGGNEKPAVKVGNTLGWLQPTGAELRIMEMATAGMHRSFPQYIERTIRALIRKERVGKK